MKDRIDVRTVEIPLLHEMEEVILLLVVDEVQPAQVLVVLTVLQIVDNENVLMSALIERMNEITANKTGTAGNDNHPFAPS